MIAILGHLELDTEVLDTSMETMESDNYRDISRKDRDVNGVLAMTWVGARFSYKDGWKFINLFT